MKICFMCDLHLPTDKNALQYAVLQWAINDIKKKKPDCIAFVGDATSDGNEATYDYFIQQMQNIGIPFIYIPGNSDLRSEQCKSIYSKTSTCETIVKNISIFALNDSDQNICEEQLKILDNAKEDSIVFMHHPIYLLYSPSMQNMEEWRKKHIKTMLFNGHSHKSHETEKSVSLQAMDPDKAIGESPCITYYDTILQECRKAYYLCSVPIDLYEHFGISCYRIENDIRLAIEKKLKNIELRPNILDMQEDTLVDLISEWRSCGGENLSVHLLDIDYDGDKVVTCAQYDRLIDIAIRLKAERFTQHVPRVSVRVIKEDVSAMDKICDYIAKRLNKINYNCVIGVENMHMTMADKPDDSRRFGYTPEETLLFMQKLSEKCKHKVGINFDIGHARNNAPYSQKYQISTWFSMIGKHIVGYHFHQVTQLKGGFENHMPITSIYGPLISCASFFKCWSENRILHAPVVFEMRPKNAYEITLTTFKEYQICDFIEKN